MMFRQNSQEKWQDVCLINLTICWLYRALILSKKISPRAFAETAKKGQEAGEVGIEGLTIEKPAEVSNPTPDLPRIYLADIEHQPKLLVACKKRLALVWLCLPQIPSINLWETLHRAPNCCTKAGYHLLELSSQLCLQGTPSLRDLKLLYYELLIKYHSHHDSYLEVCRCYKAVYEDETVAKDPEQWQSVLKKICW